MIFEIQVVAKATRELSFASSLCPCSHSFQSSVVFIIFYMEDEEAINEGKV
jgi:hypothetical protein